jgi:hypothetical protein
VSQRLPDSLAPTAKSSVWLAAPAEVRPPIEPHGCITIPLDGAIEAHHNDGTWQRAVGRVSAVPVALSRRASDRAGSAMVRRGGFCGAIAMEPDVVSEQSGTDGDRR